MQGARVGLIVLTFVALAADAAAQLPQVHAHAIPTVPEALLTRPIEIREGVGDASDRVGTASAEAQRFYDLGLNYLHAYAWIDAARAFNQALRADPNLSIAEAAVSIAYTELNLPEPARLAIMRAQRLSANSTPHDQRHVQARLAQMEAEAAGGTSPLFANYRRLLEEAVAAEPNDSELWILRGIAESADPTDRGQGSVASSIPFYERAISLGSTAAHHYLTHALENSGRAAEARGHADAYARVASAMPHALHMRGHVLRRLGEIAGAVAAFERAKALSEIERAREAWPAGVEWHEEHNLDLLGTSYWYLGQLGRAETELKRAFELPSALVVQLYNKREWPEFLIARGRTEEALAAAERLVAHASPLVRAVGHVEAGLALLNKGRNAETATRANLALRELRTATDGQALAAPALAQLQGEFLLRTGQGERARAMLRDLVAAERARPGPDNWVRTLFVLESVARSARAGGDWNFARWAAEQMIEHDPRYGGGHYALGLVAEHEGRTPLAALEFERAASAWTDADLTLPELVQIRTRQRSNRQKP